MYQNSDIFNADATPGVSGVSKNLIGITEDYFDELER